MEGKWQHRQDVPEDKRRKVREVGERAEIGEGTTGAIGSIEPTIADGLEQPTLMVPTGYNSEFIRVRDVVFDDPFSSF